MQSVPHRKKRELRHPRRWLCLAAALVLAGSLTAWALLRRQPLAIPLREDTSGVVLQRASEEVAGLRVTLDTGETWSASREEGGLRMAPTDTDGGFSIRQTNAEALLTAASTVTYEAVLSGDPAEYGEHLAELGLDRPQAVAEITYTDGSTLTLRIGAHSDSADEPFYYMTVDGDSRLLALDTGTAEVWMKERAVLRPVDQPVIHKARIDRVTFTTPEGETTWALLGDVEEGDAADRWWLLSPVRYPADGTRMDTLRSNLANIRLGAWQCEATAENLQALGFGSPRLTITLHQAAATLMSSDGTSTVDWPEDTLTISVGGEKSDVVDYVRFGDGIYLTSHFSLAVFMETDPLDTLTRYPVLTSLSNLRPLSVEAEGESTEYLVTRRERVAENNALVTDAQGNVQYDWEVTCNGEAVAWERFEAMYSDSLLVTVSGRLPDGWQPEGEPHTRMAFSTLTGTEHTIELYAFDAFHDAVAVDGCALFYLIRGGLTYALPVDGAA